MSLTPIPRLYDGIRLGNPRFGKGALCAALMSLRSVVTKRCEQPKNATFKIGSALVRAEPGPVCFLGSRAFGRPSVCLSVRVGHPTQRNSASKLITFSLPKALKKVTYLPEGNPRIALLFDRSAFVLNLRAYTLAGGVTSFGAFDVRRFFPLK